jgi:hypothetical protein
VIRGAKVDRNQPIEILDRGVLDPTEGNVARGMDKDVQGFVPRLQAGGQHANIVVVAEVTNHRMDVFACSGVPNQLIETGDITTDGDDIRASRRQGKGDGTPNAA